MGHDHIIRMSTAIAVGVAVSMSLIPLTGCSSSKKVTPADSGNKERIQESDFYDPYASQSEQSTKLTPPERDGDETQQTNESFTLSTPTRPAASVRPAATMPTPRVAQADGLELLDAKVGDINGHPIYANEFFAPIRAQLIAEANQSSKAKWNRNATVIIATRLNGIIADELLRAEALASLSQEQRLGLRSFLRGFRSDLLSQNLGSQELANRRVLEEQGITLDEALRRQEADTLIRYTLLTEINRRVNVSWRDIKQRYERDIDKYNPPPTANFRRIRVFTSSADDVAAVNQQLAEDTPFHYIAASELNTFKPEIGGEESFAIDGSFGETKFYGIDILNEKAWSLSVGEWTGPFESGSSTYWLKLEGIEQNSISLYDAQLAVKREIEVERREQAQQEYLDRLIERAHFSSREQILLQLIDIATERYGPTE